jgi:alpha-ribazole phosphatase
MRLLLVRHAETEESARGRCYGSLDVGLSPLGRAQCGALAELLAAEPLAAVVTSPRERAVETARAIAASHGLAVDVDADLRELDFGELEGRTYDEIAATLPELYAEWMTNPTRLTFPGGESYADLGERALRAVASARRRLAGGTVAFVTHGGVVRAILAEALGMPDERIFRIAVDPASVSLVEWRDGVPVVLALNRTAYAEPRSLG